MSEQSIQNDSLTVKEIRSLTGLTLKQFSIQYGVPLRTLQSWESSENVTSGRRCPDYVCRWLERLVRIDYNCPKEKNIDN